MTGSRVELKSNLKVGVPNENTGRIYPKKLFKKYMKKKLFVDLSEHMLYVDLSRIVGSVTDLFIDENNYLCGYLSIAKDNPSAITVNVLMEKGAKFELCPVCTGDVSEKTNEVSDFSMTKMSIILKENKNG
jgi:hypothetical protein